MPFLAAAAPALVSGLFGLFGKKKQTQTTRVDYGYIRDAASKAGFNPLTALQNGGSANATTTSNAPALASQAAMAEAVGQAADLWFNREGHAQQAELERLQLEIAREELAQIKANSAVVRNQSFGYGIPRTENVTGVDHASGGYPALSAAYADGLSDGLPHRPEVERASIGSGVGRVRTDPSVADAQVIEDRYGDAVSWAYGFWSGVRDLGYTSGKAIQRSLNVKRRDAAWAGALGLPAHRSYDRRPLLQRLGNPFNY